MKKIIVVMMITFCAGINAAKHEVSDTASSRAPWNLEIYNKSQGPIWISVGYNQFYDPRNSSVIDQQLLAANTKGKLQGQKARTVVDFAKVPVITIWNQKPSFIGGASPVKVRVIEVCQKLQSGEACTKQAFLTYDENGVLRPQTGQFLGLPQMFGQPGITDSGLRITNNVTQMQIKQLAR